MIYDGPLFFFLHVFQDMCYKFFDPNDSIIGFHQIDK